MTLAAPEQITWTSAGPLSELEDKSQKIFKKNGKQLLIVLRDDRLYACNNRCPHEGYPLAEGTLKSDSAGSCTLTCNWHNWKFDLNTGEAMVGGDALRLYPTRIEDGEIFIDLTDPAPGQRLPTIQKNLNEAYDDYDYERIARELARYQKDGGTLTDILVSAVTRHHERFEYGMTHAFAAAADWMTLSQEVKHDAAKHLITFLEPAAHIAWDSLREPDYPFTEDVKPWNEEAFVAAIEEENEDEAAAMIRGAASAGLTFRDIEPAFAHAALAHYQGFGHAAIYVLKIGELIEHLGHAIMGPASLALVRMLTFSSREDLIPEFRDYRTSLNAWDGAGNKSVNWEDFKGLSVSRAMARTSASSADPIALYDALLTANAWNFLHFDEKMQHHTGTNISHNVGWLNFTHSITFANAVRELCTRYPQLWPKALLQMACFLGRNTPVVDASIDARAFTVEDPETFIAEAKESLFDHSQFEHIVSGHLIKLTVATERELAANPDGPQATLLTAALNRFLQSSVKRRHVLRTANQALNFVELEG